MIRYLLPFLLLSVGSVSAEVVRLECPPDNANPLDLNTTIWEIDFNSQAAKISSLTGELYSTLELERATETEILLRSVDYPDDSYTFDRFTLIRRQFRDGVPSLYSGLVRCNRIERAM